MAKSAVKELLKVANIRTMRRDLAMAKKLMKGGRLSVPQRPGLRRERVSVTVRAVGAPQAPPRPTAVLRSQAPPQPEKPFASSSIPLDRLSAAVPAAQSAEGEMPPPPRPVPPSLSFPQSVPPNKLPTRSDIVSLVSSDLDEAAFAASPRSPLPSPIWRVPVSAPAAPVPRQNDVRELSGLPPSPPPRPPSASARHIPPPPPPPPRMQLSAAPVGKPELRTNQQSAPRAVNRPQQSVSKPRPAPKSPRVTFLEDVERWTREHYNQTTLPS